MSSWLVGAFVNLLRIHSLCAGTPGMNSHCRIALPSDVGVVNLPLQLHQRGVNQYGLVFSMLEQ